jgi:hypothetical protein
MQTKPKVIAELCFGVVIVVGIIRLAATGSLPWGFTVVMLLAVAMIIMIATRRP